MRRSTKIIFWIITFLVIAGGYVVLKVAGPSTSAPEGKYFYIHTNASYQSVKDSLLAKKILKGTFFFDRLSRYFHYDKAIKPGRYKVSEGMSVLSLVRMLKAGSQAPVNLVITKLRTKEDLVKKLSDNFETDSATVSRFIYNQDTLNKFGLDTNTVMTAIIPNTYVMLWNTSLSKVFNKLYQEQQKFWNAKRKQEAAALNLTPGQVYTLASIVEEETNRADDKGKIASVYLNRMHSGMRLSADPTVKYAMRDFGLKRIYNKYLTYPSPYNTYTVAGLPPGPICTPSVKTIDAVLSAPQTDYLYFVAKADLSGYSDFANNYEDHLKNAKAYQHALDSIIIQRQTKTNE